MVRLIRFLTVLFFATLLMFTYSNAQSAQVVKSKITDVTLYNNQALITRTYSFEAIKGEKEIIFPNLPLHLDKSSVRVKVEGSAKVVDVKTDTHYIEAKENERVKILEDKKKILKQRSDEIDSRRGNLYKQRDLLTKSFTLKNIDDTNREVREGSVNTEEWQKLIDFYLLNLDRIDSVSEKLLVKKRVINEEIVALNKELRKINHVKTKGSSSIMVGLDVFKNTKAKVLVTYMIGGAFWFPAYDLRALDSGKVELVYYGKIKQSTGEDWEGVRLKLSSANPSVSASLPILRPWVLDLWEKPEVKTYNRSKSLSLVSMAKKEMADGFAASPEQVAYSKNITATEFIIKKKTTLKSTNEQETVSILREEFDSNSLYKVTAKLKESAYLNAEIENTLEYPLLRGHARIFINDSFIGTALLEEKLPGEKLEMPFGIDEGIKVERTLLKKLRGDKGITSSKKRVEYSYKIEVTNHKEQTAKVVLNDQLPIVRNVDIKVKIKGTSLKPDKTDENGIMEWVVDIGPKEKFLLEFDFYIEYPSDKKIIGL